ncbi:hypothetical protein ACJX0J_009599, partial [Zea mays]
ALEEVQIADSSSRHCKSFAPKFLWDSIAAFIGSMSNEHFPCKYSTAVTGFTAILLKGYGMFFWAIVNRLHPENITTTLQILLDCLVAQEGNITKDRIKPYAQILYILNFSISNNFLKCGPNYFFGQKLASQEVHNQILDEPFLMLLLNRCICFLCILTIFLHK